MHYLKLGIKYLELIYLTYILDIHLIYEGSLETMAKGTTYSKLKQNEVSNNSLNIEGFQQPELHLSEHGDMRKQSDSFISRLNVKCPFPTKHRWSDIQEAETDLKQNYCVP